VQHVKKDERAESSKGHEVLGKRRLAILASMLFGKRRHAVPIFTVLKSEEGSKQASKQASREGVTVTQLQRPKCSHHREGRVRLREGPRESSRKSSS